MLNLNKIFTILFVLYPFTSVYSFGILSLGDFFLITVGVMCLLFGRFKRIKIPSGYLNFAFCVMFLPVITYPFISYSTLESYASSMLSFYLLSTLLILSYSFFDMVSGLRLLRFITIISLIFFFFQLIVKGVFGIYLSGIIPFMSLNYEMETTQFIENTSQSGRFSSFFLEPAHFAQFLVIPLSFALFSNLTAFRKSYSLAVTITLAMIFTKSGNALIALSVIWGAWFIYSLRDSKLDVKFVITTLALVVFIALVYLYKYNNEFIYLIGRIKEFDGSLPGAQSGYIRAVRGYILFLEFDILEKLFGIGGKNILNYLAVNPHSDYISLNDSIPHYLNGFQHILIANGIVGIVFYLYFIFYHYNHSNKTGKVLIFSLCVLNFFSNNFGGPLWLLVIVISITALRNDFIVRPKPYKRFSVSPSLKH